MERVAKDICDLIQWSSERLRGYMETIQSKNDPAMVVDIPEDMLSDYNEKNTKFCYSLGVREATEYMEQDIQKDWKPSSEDLMNIAEQWSGIASSTKEGNIQASDASWLFHDKYPLSGFLSLMTYDEWKEWFRNECLWASEDGRQGYGNLFLQDIRQPVVVMNIGENSDDIWDGWHRVGASIVKNAHSIPSIVGTPSLIYAPKNLNFLKME